MTVSQKEIRTMFRALRIGLSFFVPGLGMIVGYRPVWGFAIFLGFVGCIYQYMSSISRHLILSLISPKAAATEPFWWWALGALVLWAVGLLATALDDNE